VILCVQETQPSHFTKGTYDFWGHTQARLMDGLVVPKDSPEAAAAAEAMAAAEAAAAAAAGDAAPAAAAAAVAATPAGAQQQQQEEAAAKQDSSGQQPDQQQQDAAAAAAAAAAAEAAEEAEEPPHDPAHKATHVLIVRDPAGRILAVPYEHGKNHKTHGPNRKLWVIKLMEQLGLHQGDLLVATKEPFLFKPLAVRQQEAQLMQQQHLQPDGPWKKVLDR
jgi:multidrug efflux pump subunit AcrA (membrane-fusion protein)